MQQLPLETTEAPTLNEAKAHFEHWRATRPKRGKIPAHLWDKVKPLIGHYTLSTISKALSVNNNQIKENIDCGNNSEIQFAQVEPEPQISQAETIIQAASPNALKTTCQILLHRRTGETLTIDHYPVASVHTLINQFIG